VGSIPIVLVGMPGVLRDLIERDRDERTDMQIVGELSNGSWRTAFRSPLDLLILGLEDSHLPIQGERLPMHYLSPTVIGISADGRNGFIYELLRPYRMPIGELSPQVLLETIRARPPQEFR